MYGGAQQAEADVPVYGDAQQAEADAPVHGDAQKGSGGDVHQAPTCVRDDAPEDNAEARSRGVHGEGNAMARDTRQPVPNQAQDKLP